MIENHRMGPGLQPWEALPILRASTMFSFRRTRLSSQRAKIPRMFAVCLAETIAKSAVQTQCDFFQYPCHATPYETLNSAPHFFLADKRPRRLMLAARATLPGYEKAARCYRCLKRKRQSKNPQVLQIISSSAKIISSAGTTSLEIAPPNMFWSNYCAVSDFQVVSFPELKPHVFSKFII